MLQRNLQRRGELRTAIESIGSLAGLDFLKRPDQRLTPIKHGFPNIAVDQLQRGLPALANAQSPAHIVPAFGGLLIYYSDYRCRAIGRQSVVTDGRMRSDCPISSRYSPAKFAAREIRPNFSWEEEARRVIGGR